MEEEEEDDGEVFMICHMCSRVGGGYGGRRRYPKCVICENHLKLALIPTTSSTISPPSPSSSSISPNSILYEWCHISCFILGPSPSSIQSHKRGELQKQQEQKRKEEKIKKKKRSLLELEKDCSSCTIPALEIIPSRETDVNEEEEERGGVTTLCCSHVYI